ncbi:hypothetical protein [Dactylosporangium sp. AC04546]|uniref:hypothetical protein n=1 Tax=Dactylosporangium sp. AC04546 TaxID=2862460 RepID=UPI002E7B5DC7|nr:hypothetical protein [Dactylosporangium sp. AC04546]
MAGHVASAPALGVPLHGMHHVAGRTADNAAGEAFDKVVRLLGLPYQGGPRSIG